MSYGIPVIGSDSSAIPSTIGEGGLCFKTGDANDLKNRILELYNYPKKYLKFSNKAIVEANKYTDENYFKFYKNLFEKFL